MNPSNSSQKFSVNKRLKSFTYAFNGFILMFKEEPNARIHGVAALCAIVLGAILKISQNEWMWIIVAIALVFSCELMNSAIENLADEVSKDKRPRIGKAKDMAAAAVLIVSVMALLIGAFVFIPKILKLL